MTVALVHTVTGSLARCELTFVHRQPIDPARAGAQHRDYCRLLAQLGLTVRVVDTSPDHPDAVFVEDCAVLLDELAIAASMGASTRAAEVERLLPVLAGYRAVARIAPPATLEGGDVLRIGRTLYVGSSARTNAAGIAALAHLVAPFDYRVVPVAVRGCLHLKTACTALTDQVLLANPAWVDLRPLADMRVVEVAPGEPFGGNVLRLGDALCAAAAPAATNARIRALGIPLHEVDISELHKAEAGVTCLTLVFA